MKTLRLILSLSWLFMIASLLGGCVSPPPRSFVDAGELPSHYAGRERHAFARGNRLIVEITQIPGLNVVELKTMVYDGELYVTPFCISSGGGGTRRFELDVAGFHLGPDWPRHVYWLLESYAYPICNPGYSHPEKRRPWVRKQMDVASR